MAKQKVTRVAHKRTVNGVDVLIPEGTTTVNKTSDDGTIEAPSVDKHALASTQTSGLSEQEALYDVRDCLVMVVDQKNDFEEVCADMIKVWERLPESFWKEVEDAHGGPISVEQRAAVRKILN